MRYKLDANKKQMHAKWEVRPGHNQSKNTGAAIHYWLPQSVVLLFSCVQVETIPPE